ncbi:MAG: hypothetical protein IK081_03245 [Lachnospiraceae bacterium]|nr:hypothetical protein [Lachnospiraceae bacterium]
MKICFVVYREDNVMVFDSQVLEYLSKLTERADVDEVKLVLFRHQDNLRKKAEVEDKIKNYISDYKTFSSIAPPLSMLQLNIDAKRLRAYIHKTYAKNEKIGVICRGDFATVLAAKAFYNFPNSRILFDNRGLPVEESEMAHPASLLHKINRRVKKKSILFAKDHCDMYNFVTCSLRKYDIVKYKYSETIPYTVIPTLCKAEVIDSGEMKEISERERYDPQQYVVSYVGSAAAWQQTSEIIQLVKSMDKNYPNIRYFILTNGDINGLRDLSDDLKSRITVKSVPHREMKYYLKMSNIGIVIRDKSIVNKVAAPTKIAEYLISGVNILYKGDIGILSDLKEISKEVRLIHIDEDGNWLKMIDSDIRNPQKMIDKHIIQYFDLNNRLNDTLAMINNSFSNRKVR